jgi:membrane protein implicated in regulation of membrane protease activity
MEAILWLVIFLLLLIIEIFTLGLTTIWFAGGALITFIAALLHANYVVQIILFLVVSLILLFVTRPVAVKYFNKHREKTNIEEVVGKTAKVTKKIDNANGTGEATMDGQVWMARSEDGSIIETGILVTVAHVEAVKLSVKQGGKSYV